MSVQSFSARLRCKNWIRTNIVRHALAIGRPKHALRRVRLAADGVDLLHDLGVLRGDVVLFADVGGQVIQLEGIGRPGC